MQHTIVFLDRDTVGAPLRQPNFPHSYKEYADTPVSCIVDRLRDSTIAILNKVPMRAETLAQLPKLKLIAVAATGTDIVDKLYCRQNGIAVVNIRDYAFNTVPEHVFALIFALRRNLIAYREDVRNGAWQHANQFCFFPHPIRDIAGSTLGIVGLGALGKSVARRADALGMQVLATDVVAQPGLVDLFTILKESDIVTLHVPLTQQTRNMIGSKELAMMRRDAILINTARGGLVDEQALALALKTGATGGAGFDALSSEPPKNGNVLLGIDLSNFIVTPHIAWASSNTAAAAGVAQIAKAVPLAGKKVVVLAGTGPVGLRAAALFAKGGAQVSLTSRDKQRAAAACQLIQTRFGASPIPLAAVDNDARGATIRGADIVFAAGAIGVELLEEHHWRDECTIELIADCNAAPPLGVGGIDATDKGNTRQQKLAFGALGIGGLKLKLHRACIAATLPKFRSSVGRRRDLRPG